MAIRYTKVYIRSPFGSFARTFAFCEYFLVFLGKSGRKWGFSGGLKGLCWEMAFLECFAGILKVAFGLSHPLTPRFFA